MNGTSNKVRFNQGKKDTKTSQSFAILAHRHRHADAAARLEFGTAGSKNVGDHLCVVFGLEIVADVPEGVDTAHAFGGCQVVMAKIFGRQGIQTLLCLTRLVRLLL